MRPTVGLGERYHEAVITLVDTRSSHRWTNGYAPFGTVEPWFAERVIDEGQPSLGT